MGIWLTDLADACRDSGLTVIEVPGWRTRTARLHPDGMTAVRGIMWHHTATPRTAKGDYPSLTVVRDGRPGVSGPLANLGLGRSGAVLVVAAGRANHAGTGAWPGLVGGSDTIGIEAESDGSGKDWTREQLDAMPRLTWALARRYHIPPGRVIAHREWAPQRKIDPAGIDMSTLRAAVSRPAPPHPLEDDMTPAQDQLLREIRDAVCRWADTEPVRVQDRTILGVWGHQLPTGTAMEALTAAARVQAEVRAALTDPATVAAFAAAGDEASVQVVAQLVVDEIQRRLVG